MLSLKNPPTLDPLKIHSLLCNSRILQDLTSHLKHFTRLTSMAPPGDQEYSNTVLYMEIPIVKGEASEEATMIVNDLPLRIGLNQNTRFLGVYRGYS